MDWIRRHMFLIGVLVACALVSYVGITNKQKSDQDAQQNEKLTQILEQRDAEQRLAIEENAYAACTTGNENRRIIKEALQSLGEVAAAVPLSAYNGDDPIDREKLARAFIAVDQLQDRVCPPDPSPETP